MKIVDISGIQVKVKLIKPFKITFGEITSSASIIIKVKTDTGIIGYGEACPFEPVTGESISTEMAQLSALTDALKEIDPRNIEKAHAIMDQVTQGHAALKAGLDIALYDILGKDSGLPVYRLLGGNSNQITTDMTIAIASPETMANEAKKFVSQGFTQLKVKTGINIKSDEQALKAILAAVDSDVEIKVDANQGWTAKQTISILKKFEGTNIQSVEQPLPYWQHEENKLIRHAITQNLMLDESVHSPHDAYSVLKNDEADIVNIKLMKSAGIFGAESINKIAEAAGAPCMIG
ncbi:dipeptide epimerase [Secundilactobacillus kimchicus]|uniref:dipeptide epimerase n=1 Tax=Secundilactobacillus kimchicus TaxID=528209 RepID=UPI0024A950C8|nr:dipeptide epimerase [Secundilactobacillus kimchicus]